ncbi:MAG: hypothetical protein MHM6MM_003931 [Cercozoa sp. M6MM]
MLSSVRRSRYSHASSSSVSRVWFEQKPPKLPAKKDILPAQRKDEPQTVAEVFTQSKRIGKIRTKRQRESKMKREIAKAQSSEQSSAQDVCSQVEGVPVPVGTHRQRHQAEFRTGLLVRKLRYFQARAKRPQKRVFVGLKEVRQGLEDCASATSTSNVRPTVVVLACNLFALPPVVSEIEHIVSLCEATSTPVFRLFTRRTMPLAFVSLKSQNKAPQGHMSALLITDISGAEPLWKQMRRDYERLRKEFSLFGSTDSTSQEIETTSSRDGADESTKHVPPQRIKFPSSVAALR